MALTKIKLDSFVSGNLSDANIPNNITIDTASAAPASGLTGNTLASGVTASSLTSVGTLTSLNVSGQADIASDTYPQLDIDGTDNSGNIGFTFTGSGARGGMRWNSSNNDVEILKEGGGVEISLLDGGGTTFAGNIQTTAIGIGKSPQSGYEFDMETASGNANMRLKAAGTNQGIRVVYDHHSGDTAKIDFHNSGNSSTQIVSNEITNGLIFKVGGTGGSSKIDALKIDSSGYTHITERLVHSGDTDTFIRFTDDAVNFSAGNTTPLVLAPTSGTAMTVGGNATSYGNQLFYPNAGWNTANIAFGSANSSFTSNNTGARIEVPLHATGGSAHGSFKFYTNSGDSQKYSLLLSEAGHVECQQKLYVVANYASQFGTELYNQSSTGHGTKIRGGSTSSHYALYVSNYDQTVALFSVMGDGSATLKSNFTAQGGVVDGDSGLKTQQAEFKRLTSNSFSNNNLHDLTQVHQRPFIVKVEDSAGGLSTMGFPIGGSGIAYNWSLFDSDSNTWTSNQATITSTGTSGNTYHFTFNTGSGMLRIQRTNGSLSFTVRVYQIAE